MTRRQAGGLLLAALILAGGRLVRERLLLGPDGAWREPLLWEHLLPPPPPEEPEPAAAGPPPVLDANGAPADSLVLLPGVGPVLAERIVAARTAGGPFAGPRDLQRVRGIGPKLSAKLAPYLLFPAPCDSGGKVGAAAVQVAAPDSQGRLRAANGLSSCNDRRR